MADRPRYEAEPSPRFLAALRAAVPGFEPTPLGWIEFEIELKRRLRLRDQAAFAVNHQACWEWSEDEVLEVFTPSAAAPPPAAARPGFPAMPLDPWCVVSADLSLETREEIVRLVRLVQTDFDPENDPRGWDSVAVLVRGVGYGEEEVRRMGYPQLAAIFRTSAAQMRLQKTGSLVCGIATSTSSIVSLDAAPNAKPQRKPRGEIAADILRRMWADSVGKQKILAARSAEGIGLLIGKSATQVKTAGRIWDDKIAPALKAQRTLTRYHREEERLDR